MNKLINQDNNIDIICLFALVGMFITGSMSAIAFLNNSNLLAAALFLASAVYAIAYTISKRLNNARIASGTIIYSLYLLMFYLIYSGGVDNTGPLWIFIVSPVSLFLHGLKRGLIDLTFFVIIITGIMFFPFDTLVHITSNAAYSINFKLRLLYSFLTITFLSAIYERSRINSYNKALELSKKYEYLANKDPLTKLSNRRDACLILKQEQARSSRNDEPLSLILCDIDHFKKVNDRYGHNAGDLVLVELAKIFNTAKRSQDFIARWGGEEFLFILPNTSSKQANLLAEKIQERIRNHIVYYEDDQIKITTSMGIEQLTYECTIDDAINNADKLLYQAKTRGRNQIFSTFN